MGHEKIIRGTGDPDEGGRVPIQGGSRKITLQHFLSSWGERQYIGNEYFSIFPGQ